METSQNDEVTMKKKLNVSERITRREQEHEKN